MNSQLIKDSFFYPSLMLSVSFLNFLFQVYLARHLPKFEYGLINGLFSVLMIITVPCMAFQNTLSKYISEFLSKGHENSIPFLFQKSFKHVLKIGLMIGFFFVLFSIPLSRFLHAPSPLSLILVGLAAGVAFITPVLSGTFLGLQKFIHLGFISVVSTLIKLCLGIGAILLGFSIMGILNAFLISLIVSVVLLYLYLPKGITTSNIKGSSLTRGRLIFKFGLKNFMGLFFLSALTSMDVIWVQHFFGTQNSVKSGIYAIASMMGKIIFFGTQPFIHVMIPKLSDKSSSTILLWYLGLTLLMGAGLMGLYGLSPEWCIQWFSKTHIPEIQSILLPYTGSVVSLSLIYLVTNYCLTRERFWILPLLAVGLLSESILIYFFRSTLLEISYILLYFQSGLFVVIVISLIWSNLWRMVIT